MLVTVAVLAIMANHVLALYSAPISWSGFPSDGFSYGGKVDNVNNQMVFTLLPPSDVSRYDDGYGAIATSWDTLLYGTVEATIQQATVGGAVTYLTLINQETKDEVDFEWIGNERHSVWTNMFYRGRRERRRVTLDEIWSAQVGTGPVDNSVLGGMHTYRIDWFPDSITWWVDGTVVRVLNRASTFEAAHTGDRLPYDHYHYPNTPLSVNFGIWDSQSPIWSNGPINWRDPATQKGFQAKVWDIKITPYTGSIPQYTDPLIVPALTETIFEDGPPNAVPTNGASSQMPPGYQYVNCFRDDINNRLLLNRLTSNYAMTPGLCGNLAAAAGYNVFGVEYSTECWGAKSLSYNPSTSSQCTMTCEGDRAQFCGGSGAISVYSNLNPVPVAPQAPDIPAGFRYTACYRDDNFNRLLTNKLQAQQGMTVGLCGQLAVSAGYTIFGVEYASECWAASLLAYSPSGSDQCNMACQGRNDQICGGPGALSLYTNQGSLPVSDSQPTNSAPAGFQYINCYQDSNSNRLLVNRLSTTQGMTIEVCAQLARASGYNTFGVEYSSECWAANALAYQPSGSVQCSMRCQGDNSKLCGGAGAISTYSTSSSLSVAAAASNPAAPPGFQFYGCYEDITWNRLIPNRLASRQDMTVALCAQLATAAGYKVFGVEWSVECWGANGWAYTPNSSNNCNMRCGGDASQLCGGSAAVSVYSA